MDWDLAKKYCMDRGWKWSLDFINQAEEDMIALEQKVKSLEAEQKNYRL